MSGNFVGGILASKTYENEEEPDYDHGEEAKGGDTTIGQIKAFLGGSSVASGAGLMAFAPKTTAALAGAGLVSYGGYKTVDGVLEMAGVYDIDEKIRNDETHLDSDSYEK